MKHSVLIGSTVLTLCFGAGFVYMQFNHTETNSHNGRGYAENISETGDVPIKTRKADSEARLTDHALVPPSSGTAAKVEDNITEADSRELQNKVQSSVDQLVDAIDSGETVLRRHIMVDMMVRAATLDDEFAQLLSKKLISAFNDTTDLEKRETFVSMLLAIPSTDNQELGHELIDTSATIEERILGYELIRDEGRFASTGANERVLESVWSDGPEGAVAINTINTKFQNSDDRNNVIASLTDVADTHSNLDVRASALMKMAEIDQGDDTRRRIEHALSAKEPSLRYASVVAATHNQIQSPKIKQQLFAILNDNKQPAELQNLARSALQHYN